MHLDPFPMTNTNAKRRIVKIHLSISNEWIPYFNYAHHFPMQHNWRHQAIYKFLSEQRVTCPKAKEYTEIKINSKPYRISRKTTTFVEWQTDSAVYLLWKIYKQLNNGLKSLAMRRD